MDNGYMQEIRARILAAEDGAVFVAPDFADIADTATIRQGLKRALPIWHYPQNYQRHLRKAKVQQTA